MENIEDLKGIISDLEYEIRELTEELENLQEKYDRLYYAVDNEVANIKSSCDDLLKEI